MVYFASFRRKDIFCRELKPAGTLVKLCGFNMKRLAAEAADFLQSLGPHPSLVSHEEGLWRAA